MTRIILKPFHTILFFLFGLSVTSFALSPAPDRAARHEARIGVPATAITALPDYRPGLLKLESFFDIKISETVAPATFEQTRSDLGGLDDGSLIAVWQDDRLGADIIFRQLFDSDGNASGINEIALARDDGYGLIEPRVISDNLGGYYLAVRDRQSGRILAARCNKNGDFQVAPFIINDIESGGFAGPFDIAAYPDGRLVAVWEDYRSGSFIALRIFSSDATALTDIITVNDDGGESSHWVPSVAIESSGNLGVVWEDYRTGNADIYMQLVNADGSLAGSNFNVVEAAYDDDDQYLPQAVYSSVDGFIIGWLDRRDGDQRAYVRRYVRGTGLVGNSVNISDNAAGTDDWDLALDINSQDNLVAAWASLGISDRILIQKFSSGVIRLGIAITMNQTPDGSRWETALALDANDDIYCGWSDQHFGHSDIFLSQLSSTGIMVYPVDYKINDDIAGAHSTAPAMAALPGGNSMIVFSDKRFDDGDIFLQEVAPNGQLLGDNRRINNDTAPNLQADPDVAASAATMMVVWNDSRSLRGATGQRIFAKRYLLPDLIESPDFAVSDSGSISSKAEPKIAMASDGRALVAWIDYAGGPGQVYGRFYDPAGTGWSDIFQISLPATETGNTDLNLVCDAGDDFTVAWISREYSGGPAAVFVRYDKTMGPLGRFSFAGDQSGIDLDDIAVGTDPGGLLNLLWIGAGDTRELYLTILGTGGTVVGTTVAVCDSPAAAPLEPAVSVGPGGMVTAAWIDARLEHRQTFYQLYDDKNDPVGVNAPVSISDSKFMASPAVAGDNTGAWIGWVDPRQDGLNIYLSRIDYTPTGISGDDPATVPDQFDLTQNYPNPFNPSTAIRFTLPVKDRVELAVFDLLGRKVAVLTDRVYGAGVHTVNWNGTDEGGHQVASGIYFYRIKTGDFQRSRKMLLMK